MCLINTCPIFQIWRCPWQSWLVATRESGWGWLASLFSFMFIYLISVGAVSISRTIIPKIHLCWIQIPESILAAARWEDCANNSRGTSTLLPEMKLAARSKKYHILKNNLWLFKFWTLFLTGSSGEPWSRGALSKIPPLWPWRPCHCWGLEGHHQGEVRSAFFEPVWSPTKHKHSL